MNTGLCGRRNAKNTKIVHFCMSKHLCCTLTNLRFPLWLMSPFWSRAGSTTNLQEKGRKTWRMPAIGRERVRQQRDGWYVANVDHELLSRKHQPLDSTVNRF